MTEQCGSQHRSDRNVSYMYTEGCMHVTGVGARVRVDVCIRQSAQAGCRQPRRLPTTADSRNIDATQASQKQT